MRPVLPALARIHKLHWDRIVSMPRAELDEFLTDLHKLIETG